ncbi:hypothetical protein TNCV_1246521 [Trichonephila clavipes]|uniref:Uncharacterized protein n=1 Tax=Trichonephila clavipes TaxID=2585209 RepID=A0A8X6RET6_TRICX|nr:hypothetical protein TNCV_1246521 [Trichonephila clavipes]
MKVVEDNHRTSISAQDPYLALSVRRNRQITAPQLARDFTAVSERRIIRHTLYSRPLHPASSLECSFDCIQQKRQHMVELIAMERRGNHKNGCVFFSVMSRNSPDKLILL